MLYVDSNIFCYAVDEGELGQTARRKLVEARDGPGICTSTLTLDEVMWSLQKLGKTRRQVEDVARRFLRLDRLKLFAVERPDLETAVGLYGEGLDPRDAIHVAVAINHKCEAILSNDTDMKRCTSIGHLPL